MKKIIYMLICILMVAIVGALNECQDIETSGGSCEVVTPVISCSTYDMYAPNHSIMVNDGAMMQIGTTGIYYFIFDEVPLGAWTIHLCSNHVGVITVNQSLLDYVDNTYDWLTTEGNIVNDTELDDMNTTIREYGDAHWSYDAINQTSIAKNIWEYNITRHISEDISSVGGLIRLIYTITSWIERLT